MPDKSKDDDFLKKIFLGTDVVGKLIDDQKRSAVGQKKETKTDWIEKRHSLFHDFLEGGRKDINLFIKGLIFFFLALLFAYLASVIGWVDNSDRIKDAIGFIFEKIIYPVVTFIAGYLFSKTR